MTMSDTLGAFAVSAALAVLCLWRGFAATKIGRVRMIPWKLMGFFFVVVAFMMIVHLANLAGMETGRR